MSLSITSLEMGLNVAGWTEVYYCTLVPRPMGIAGVILFILIKLLSFFNNFYFISTFDFTFQPSEKLFYNAVKNANKKRIGEKSNEISTKHSIFHKKEPMPMKIDALNDNIPSDMDISYDGLGGHSKPDVFPVPSKAPVKSCIPKVSAKHKLKRPSPTGSQDIEKMMKKVKNK